MPSISTHPQTDKVPTAPRARDTMGPFAMRNVALALLAAPSCALQVHMPARATLRHAPRAVAPSMLAPLPDLPALLLAGESAPEEVGPLLLGQIGAVAGLIGGGFALEAFFDVDEPKEPGAAEGEIDIYRDSLLRFLGYANEVGEAFRPLVPVQVVYVSYVLAISYILADTVDKGRKGAAAGGEGAAVRGTLGALDTFFWQMLASVVFPSFCINRIVLLLDSLQEAGSMPELLQVRTRQGPLHPGDVAFAVTSSACPAFAARSPCADPAHSLHTRRRAGCRRRRA